ncbi:DUF5713 family protein [uncultured Alistipes sp.]|uniref:DUF5713 family protein n=1 Tax=uncultured Alistipes sp. TaxID=538949 RepID=UPI00262AA437|nr:DUF5713 family protein [uncultured Alistipes sp.]
MSGKKFDADYPLLEAMYADDYYPIECVDKVAERIGAVIAYLEQGGHSKREIQAKLDEMTIGINELEEDFEENDSEIETVARDCIGTTVEYILRYFDIDIDIEEAIRERDW